MALGTIAVLVFAWRAPALPLDDLATRLRPGTEIDRICADQSKNPLCLSTIAGDLMKGEHLVVIADLADPAFRQAVAALNQTASTPGGPQVWVLAAATPEQVSEFHWTQGPVFKVVEAPAPLLRPLYRRMPRAFRVKDGEVVETWSGLPPLSMRSASRGSLLRGQP